jgi:3-deoxy-D-manno-octulosonate 8-phosphate phosphatase (KDO 8-P phosphatase)
MLDAAATRAITLLALDVDGVLTDGQVIYGNHSEEYKAFNIKDGLGIKLCQQAGIEVALITGRSSAIVARRAAELGIQHVIQGREDKLTALKELLTITERDREQCAYMGDDLPDRAAIQYAGIGACPADAVGDVKTCAVWHAKRKGGDGAVREFIEALLHARDQWHALVAQFDP